MDTNYRTYCQGSSTNNLKDFAKAILLVGILGPAVLIMCVTLSLYKEWD